MSMTAPPTASTQARQRPRRRLRTIAVVILGLVLAAYLAGGVLLYTLQDRFIYYPTPALKATPADLNMPFEDVTFHTPDGVKLHAWFVPGTATGDPVVLVLHGNDGNIGQRVGTVRQLRGLGLAVLIIDYRGYGRSEGKPSETGLYADARTAWEYLTIERGYAPGRVVLLGRSLGGAVATRLAWSLADQGRERPAGLIVESSFTSLVDMGQLQYPYMPIRLLARQRFDSIGRIGEVGVPVLISHSVEDEFIPVQQARRLYAAAAEPKQWLEMVGGHGRSNFETGEAYERGMAEFLATLFPVR